MEPAFFDTVADGKYDAAALPQDPIVVEYSVDKDDVIDFIDEAPISALAGAQDLTKKGYYDGKAVNSDAIMFTFNPTAYPVTGANVGDLSNADKYGITSLTNATEKNFRAYYVTDSGKIKVMLIIGLGSGAEDIYGVVTGRIKTTASSSNYQITMLVNGEEVKYEIESGEYAKFPGTYDYATVYQLDFNAKGQVSLLTPLATMSTSGGFEPASDYTSNRILVTNADDYTVDADAVAYKWNATAGVYEKSSKSKSNLVGKEVDVYDIDSTPDGVVDIILIQTDSTALLALPASATSFKVQSATSITIVFDEVLKARSFLANDANGFAVAGAGTLTKAELGADGITVTLTGTGFVAATTTVAYDDTVGTITDLADNALATFAATATN